MSRFRWENNLRRLQQNLDKYVEATSIVVQNPEPQEARVIGESLCLAHSTADRKFAAICDSKLLLSPAQLADRRGSPLRADSAEAVLGTSDYVFFYAAPFRFPATGCGVLFAPSLEKNHREDGTATPFDSGGLLNHLSRTDPDEPAREFMLRFELPIPDHREYLCRSLVSLFNHPLNYLDGTEPHSIGPIELSGNDSRRWTHEVRIPEKVFLHSADLKAVFARRALVGRNPAIESLYRWCDLQGIDFITFDSPRSDDFETLRRECIEYIRRQVVYLCSL